MDVTQGIPDAPRCRPSMATGCWRTTPRRPIHRRFTSPCPRRPATAFAGSPIRIHAVVSDIRLHAQAAGAPEGVTLATAAPKASAHVQVPRTVRRVKISGAQSADVIEARRVDGMSSPRMRSRTTTTGGGRHTERGRPAARAATEARGTDVRCARRTSRRFSYEVPRRTSASAGDTGPWRRGVLPRTRRRAVMTSPVTAANIGSLSPRSFRALRR